MEGTCFKTLKLQNFVKCFGKVVKQRPLHDVIFQSFPRSFQVIYRDQIRTETSVIPAICIFKRTKLIFQNSGIFISFATSLSPNWVKRAQSCISFIESDRKIEINFSWNFERSLFLRSLSRNIMIDTWQKDESQQWRNIWGKVFVFETNVSKFWSFDFPGWRH